MNSCSYGTNIPLEKGKAKSSLLWGVLPSFILKFSLSLVLFHPFSECILFLSRILLVTYYCGKLKEGVEKGFLSVVFSSFSYGFIRIRSMGLTSSRYCVLWFQTSIIRMAEESTLRCRKTRPRPRNWSRSLCLNYTVHIYASPDDGTMWASRTRPHHRWLMLRLGMEMRVWPKDGYGGVASGSNGFQVQQSPDFWRELGKEGGVTAVLVRTQQWDWYTFQ